MDLGVDQIHAIGLATFLNIATYWLCRTIFELVRARAAVTGWVGR